MKVAVRRKYCTPIETLTQPIPKANEVLVKIQVTTINRTDCTNLTAKPFIMRFTLGLFKPNKLKFECPQIVLN